MKTCSKCNECKPVVEFAWKNKAKQTRASMCKKCHSLYSITHYKGNSEQYKDRSAKRNAVERLKVTEFINQYLRENPCVDCGETNINVLEFDHVVMIGSKAKRVAHFSTVKTVAQEIAKCEVRCCNCHTIRTRTMMGTLRE